MPLIDFALAMLQWLSDFQYDSRHIRINVRNERCSCAMAAAVPANWFQSWRIFMEVDGISLRQKTTRHLQCKNGGLYYPRWQSRYTKGTDDEYGSIWPVSQNRPIIAWAQMVQTNRKRTVEIMVLADEEAIDAALFRRTPTIAQHCTFTCAHWRTLKQN